MSTKTRTLYPTTGKTRPETDRVEKPKQTKSRTGCVTCKAKRLKCDEAKPTCLKCKKREVVCEGYKKDWKWRPCETEAFTIKTEGPKQKKGTITFKVEETNAQPKVPRQESFESSTTATSVATPKDPNFKVWSPKATRQPKWDNRPQAYPPHQEHNHPLQQHAGFDTTPPLSLSPPQSQDEPYTHNLGYQPPNSYIAHAHQQEQSYKPPQGNSWTLPQYSAASNFPNLPSLSHVGVPPASHGTGFHHNAPSLSKQASNVSATSQYGQYQAGYRHHSRAHINQLLHPSGVPEPPASPSPSQASQSTNRSTSSQTPTIEFMLNKDPAPQFRPSHYIPPLPTQMSHADDVPEGMLGILETSDPIEEIARNPSDNAQILHVFPSHPSSSDSSSTPSEPEVQILDTRRNPDPQSTTSQEMWNQIFQWKYSPSHPDMLVRTFMDNTCGILSVKNGETENPWKTLIWPLAHESPALRHAIISMAAFHGSEDNKELIFAGVSHSNKSFKGLRHDLESVDATKVIASLATSLALAFSESWNEDGTGSGVTHLNAAKHLVKRAKEVAWQRPVSAQLMSALSFLLNTYVYVAVIARLISIDDENTDFDANPPSASSQLGSGEIDPLMGCAGTLYPIIGKVTKLVGRVRKNKGDRNTKAILEESRYLKSLVERWEPPSSFEPVEDPTLEEQHSILTAEAYRATTLLYLHQAVPEIESEAAAELASRALSCLAAVPITSGAVIIQIFPLLAAGCEASSKEVRAWVENRWDEMKRRMKIRNLDRCLDVTREVWARRDRRDENDPPDVTCGAGPQLFSVSLPQTEFYIPGQDAMNFGFPVRVFDYAGGTPKFPGQIGPENQGYGVLALGSFARLSETYGQELTDLEDKQAKSGKRSCWTRAVSSAPHASLVDQKPSSHAKVT